MECVPVKKITGWFMVAVFGLALSLGACGSDDDSDNSSSEDTEADDSSDSSSDDTEADDGGSSSEGETASPEVCEAFATADFESAASLDLYPEDLQDDLQEYQEQIVAYAEDSTNNPLPGMSDELIAFLDSCIQG
jgi:hypothetical protein